MYMYIKEADPESADIEMRDGRRSQAAEGGIYLWVGGWRLLP